MSTFYPYEIVTASSEVRPELERQHNNAILDMTADVAMEVISAIAFIGKDDRPEQAKAFARVLATPLRHVPAGHLDEIRDPLANACFEQLAMRPKERPSAYEAMCGVHMLCAIPGLWSFNDLCGGYGTLMSKIRGADSVQWATTRGVFFLDESKLWLEWAEKGFGPWGQDLVTRKPIEGGWTPPPTKIKQLWDRLPEEERVTTCNRALIYLQRGVQLAERMDDAWREQKR